jgi:hypothetical protein
MKWWTALLLMVGYVVLAVALLYGVLSMATRFEGKPSLMTLFAALAGALLAAIGPITTAILTTIGQHRDVDERIRDEASRVALELTRMDYELRQQALPEGGKKTFLAPAKVYRELYRAIVELRTKDTWPRSIQDLGLLGIFKVKRESQRSDARDAETAT